MQCAVDVDFQSSTNSLRAYWEVPLPIAYYTPDVHFSVEERSPVGSMHLFSWNYMIIDYEY